MKRISLWILALLCTAGQFALSATQPTEPLNSSNSLYVRTQLRFFEYSLGTIYHEFMAVQSGIKAEAFLFDNTLIPTVEFHRDLLNMTEGIYEEKPTRAYYDFRAGVRLGISGSTSFKNLKCIDREVDNGKTYTEYYESESVQGIQNFGLTGGVILNRSTINPFTKESTIRASAEFTSQNVYGGLSLTKFIKGTTTKYKSGNTCTWDQYKQFYAHAVYAAAYQLNDKYYNAGSEYVVFDNQQHLRQVRRTGLIVGYESGRMLRGITTYFEFGLMPSVVGKGGYFKTGFSYVFGFGD